jgi:hypothetical protein
MTLLEVFNDKDIELNMERIGNGKVKLTVENVNMYSEISKGIKINTPSWKLKENLERHLIENDKFLQRKKEYINKLIANGLTPVIAQAMGNVYFRKITNTMKTIKYVEQVKQQVSNKQRVEMAVNPNFHW